jgi:hypothetical protein
MSTIFKFETNEILCHINNVPFNLTGRNPMYDLLTLNLCNKQSERLELLIPLKIFHTS